MSAEREERSKAGGVIQNLTEVAYRFREHYRGLCISDGSFDKNVHAAFGLAFDQVCASAKAITLILREGDESLFVNLPTLCRPAFEFAVRLYWAWSEPERWLLLSVHWVHEDLKQARELSRLEGTPREPDVILLLTEILDRLDPKRTLRKTHLSFERILADIDDHQVNRRDTKLRLSQGDATYAVSYRTMCHTAHGHLFATRSNPQDYVTHGKVGIQMAIIAMLAAFARWVASDDADLRRKREIADRVLCLAYDNKDFDIKRLRLLERTIGSTRVSDWSLVL